MTGAQIEYYSKLPGFAHADAIEFARQLSGFLPCEVITYVAQMHSDNCFHGESEKMAFLHVLKSCVVKILPYVDADLNYIHDLVIDFLNRATDDVDPRKSIDDLFEINYCAGKQGDILLAYFEYLLSVEEVRHLVYLTMAERNDAKFKDALEPGEFPVSYEHEAWMTGSFEE